METVETVETTKTTYKIQIWECNPTETFIDKISITKVDNGGNTYITIKKKECLK